MSLVNVYVKENVKIANVNKHSRHCWEIFDNLLKIKIIYSKGGKNFMPKMIDLSG